jgi:hypothetical protein
MPSIVGSTTRPDSKYYLNIEQQPDGTWNADQIPLDDVRVGRLTTGAKGQLSPGLRTLTGQAVAAQAQQLIFGYAPPDLQRNFLQTLATSTSGTPWTNAKAAMDWVAAVNAYRDSQIANVHTLTFDQLVAYIVPVGTPPWPVPPASLPPLSTPTSTGVSATLARGPAPR